MVNKSQWWFNNGFKTTSVEEFAGYELPEGMAYRILFRIVPVDLGKLLKLPEIIKAMLQGATSLSI